VTDATVRARHASMARRRRTGRFRLDVCARHTVSTVRLSARQLPSGDKKTPLVAGSTATQPATGAIGYCVLPATTVIGVSMNVTVLDGTTQSNLRLYPAKVAALEASEPFAVGNEGGVSRNSHIRSAAGTTITYSLARDVRGGSGQLRVRMTASFTPVP